MQSRPVHEIELFPHEVFKTLLDNEVKKSRRYGDSLTLIDLLVETESADSEVRHSAEVFTINVLNLHLRETDIPCKRENEFLVLMPSTSMPGARTACERIRKLMNPAAAATHALEFATSSDGITWSVVELRPAESYVAKTWKWFELISPGNARYFRIRETGTGILGFYEIYLATDVVDLPMSPLNIICDCVPAPMSPSSMRWRMWRRRKS